MHKFALHTLLASCVAASLTIAATTACAQAVAAVSPGASVASAPLAGTYEGTAIWQRPDGAFLRGNIYLAVGAIFSGNDTLQDRFTLQAFLFFGSQSDGTVQSFSFAGQLDANGRGIFRRGGGLPGAAGLPRTMPELNPGKVSVLVSPGRGVAGGGVLAEDGTQLTFRAVRTAGAP